MLRRLKISEINEKNKKMNNKRDKKLTINLFKYEKRMTNVQE